MIELKDIQGDVIYSTPINVNSKRKYTLMQEDYITLKFSTNEPLNVGIGCKVDDENIGLFELVSPYNPKINANTGGYDYELRLDAYYWKWKNKIFKFSPEIGGQEASWSLTASLDVHLGIFLDNLKTLGYKYRNVDFVFSIDSTVENKSMALTYENMNMLDALSAMAEKWDCEWWVVDNTIHFGRCEYGTPVDFIYGENVVDMTSSENKSQYATRLYVFGSTRNLPSNYRPTNESVVVNGVVQKRLMLPIGKPYIDAYEGMRQEEAIEEVVIIEDVYPKTDGNISYVSTYDDTVENEDGTTTTETFYRFKDSGFNFSEDYILEGEELRVQFTSGSLNGMEFGVKFNPEDVEEKIEGEWNPEAQLFEVIASEDYGRKLPDSTLHPKAGDKYVLIGWDSTKIADLGLVAKAEEELYQQGLKVSAKRKIDPNTYNCKMFSDYMYGMDENNELDASYAKHFEIGDRVNLINPVYFENGRQSRIIGYEYNLDMPYDSPIYTIGEMSARSRIGELESKVEALTYGGQTYTGGSGSGVYIIGTNDTTKPTNRNVYSALRTDESYLSKKNNDTANGRITFKKGLISKGTTETDDVIVNESIHSKEFVSGFTGGKGWTVRFKEFLNSAGVTEERSELEIDDVTVRGVLKVFEFVVSQMLGENDNRIFTAMLEVDHYDEETGIVWLDTQNGKLYNPFRVDDVILVQQYNGSPSEDNDYYITKQYELVVTEVGVGDLSLGEERLDWIKFRNFASPMVGATNLIAKGDTFVRIDNISNPDRKGIIQMMTVGTNTPYMDVVYGKKTDPDNALKCRFGNLQGIYNPLFGYLKDFGAYLTNLYAVGEFKIAHTGEDVSDAIEMSKGVFRTNFKDIEYEITEENFISNGVFSGDLSMWVLGESNTNFLTVDETPIYTGRNFMSVSESYCGIDEYLDRNMMRIYNSKVVQPNEFIKQPTTHKEYEEGEEGSIVENEVLDTLYLDIQFYCREGGNLWVGFTDNNGNPIVDNTDGAIQNTSIAVEPNIERQTLSIQGTWDGEGNFTISTDGDVYIKMAYLGDDPLENLKAEYGTRIEQDSRRIALIAEKTSATESKVAQLEITANGITGRVEAVENTAEGLKSDVAQLELTANGLSSTVASAQGSADEAKRLAQAASTAANTAVQDANDAWNKASQAQSTANSFASAIEQNSEAISLWSGSFDSNGKISANSGAVLTSNFATLFSQQVTKDGIAKTAEIQTYVDDQISGIRLTADKITFEGHTNINEKFIVDQSGNITLGGFNVNQDGLNTTQKNINISFDFDTNRFFRINSSYDDTFVNARRNDGTLMRLTAEGDNAVALELSCSSYGYGLALNAAGRMKLIARYAGVSSSINEMVNISGLALACKSGTTFSGPSNLSNATNAWVDFIYATDNITLPNANACPGKILFVKLGGNYKVSCSSYVVRAQSSTTYTSETFDNRALIFISDGTNWYEFKCYGTQT